MANTSDLVNPFIRAESLARVQGAARLVGEKRQLAEELVGNVQRFHGLIMEILAFGRQCAEYPSTLRGFWNEVQASCEETPRTPDELEPDVAAFFILLDTYQASTQLVHDALRNLEASYSRPKDEGDFSSETASDVLEELQSIRTEITALWEWSNASPPLGRRLRTTAEIKAAMEAGEYLSVDDAIAQMGETLSEGR